MQLHVREWVDLWPTIVEQGLERTGNNVLKVSAGGHVSRLTVSFSQGPVDLICKQNRPRGIISTLLSVLLASREWQSFVLGNRLLDAGVMTPLPLAVLHRRRGIGREGVLITEAVSGAADLDRACKVQLPRRSGAPLVRAKRELTEAIVSIMSTLHRMGLYHRDMKAQNLLVTGLSEQAGPVRAWLIDLDGLRRRGGLAGKQLWQPLMRLNASLSEHAIITRTDRLRFLRGFLTAIGRRPDAAKGYWRMLEPWSARYLKRQRRQRPWEGTNA